MRQTHEEFGAITRIDVHVESAFFTCERGTIEKGAGILRIDQDTLVYEERPQPANSRTVVPIAPRGLGRLLRLNAWCEQIPVWQLRMFDRIATLAGKCVVTGAAIYLILEIANAWLAGRFHFGGN